ncbi:hypothetical protein BO79DRAFT_215744 [Aspergillus costaricaensis CBS 115574]|uniref:Uncharacterized protein n=1 Tax=Aspergillus costaricaensis CBS 115574 TaxID=1448317 RepID=A0ACD1IKV3_9EURO|nr:hypothetical protein BO79DRAFT_215744 [Aspergillus costaricaensis CBS 115574]RAK90740.1 hypothetical protein BO79DRAFT_215744 [Aspergillus costaricaensis CBS 115574]
MSTVQEWARLKINNTTAQPVAASAGPMSYDADISMLQDSVNLPSSQVASYQPAMAGNNASFLQNPVGQYPYPEPSNYQQNVWVNQQQPQLSNVAFQSVAQLGTQNPGFVNYQINTLVNQQHPELFGGVFESVVQMGMQNHVDELTDGIIGPVNDEMIEPRKGSWLSLKNILAFSPDHTPLQLFLAHVSAGGGDPVINTGRVIPSVRTSSLLDGYRSFSRFKPA